MADFNIFRSKNLDDSGKRQPAWVYGESCVGAKWMKQNFDATQTQVGDGEVEDLVSSLLEQSYSVEVY